MAEGAPQPTESAADDQTTTQVQLPEARGKRAARSPAVLVVGDGEPLGDALLECMKRRGLVVAASPTERAIASAVARAPDLVVLVGDAAKEGGQRTIRMLATRPTTARLPVVVLEDAAGDALDRRLRALRAGALAIVDRSASADAMAGRVADLAIFVADHGKRTAAGIDVTLDELASVVRKELGQLLPDEDGAGATMEAPGREMAEAIERFVASVRAMVRRSDPDAARLRGAPAARNEGEAVADLAAFDDGATHALRGARLLVVVDDAGRGDALATELRARGATVVVSGPRAEGLARARELDPEVVLVDADALQPDRLDVVGWLSRDPRLRWSPVLVTNWEDLAPRGVNVPRMPAIAERIAPCRALERELVARAHEEARLDVDIASLGPCRALRALASVPHVLSVTTLEDPGGLVIDVANGLVAGATQRDGAAGLAALARFLALPPCTLHVERRRAPQSANVLLPVEDALALAGRELFASIPVEHDELEAVTIPGVRVAPRVVEAPIGKAPPPTHATHAAATLPEPPVATPKDPPPISQPPLDPFDDSSDTATDVSPLRKDLPRLSMEPGALSEMLEPETTPTPGPAIGGIRGPGLASPGAHKRTLTGVSPLSAPPVPAERAERTASTSGVTPAPSALPNPFASREERSREAPLPVAPPALPEAFPGRPPPLPPRPDAAAAGKSMRKATMMGAAIAPPTKGATMMGAGPALSPAAKGATMMGAGPALSPAAKGATMMGAGPALSPGAKKATMIGAGPPALPARTAADEARTDPLLNDTLTDGPPSAFADAPDREPRPDALATAPVPEGFTSGLPGDGALPDPFASGPLSVAPLPPSFPPRPESVAPLPDPFAPAVMAGAPPASAPRLPEAFAAPAPATAPLPDPFAPAVAAAVPRAAPVAPAARPKSSGPSGVVLGLGALVLVALLGGGGYAVWHFTADATTSAPIAVSPLQTPRVAVQPPAPVAVPHTPNVVPTPTPNVAPTPTPNVVPNVVPTPTPNVAPTPTPNVAHPPTPNVVPTPTPNVAHPPTPNVAPTPNVTPTPTPTPNANPTHTDTPAALDAPLPEVEQSEALTEQARALLDHHDEAGAEPLLLQAAALGPRNPHPMEALARLYLARGDAPHAVEWAEKLVGVRHRRAAFRILLGDARKLAGDQSGAESAWRGALELEPDNHDAHARLGE